METKKPNGGYSRLKVKYAKLQEQLAKVQDEKNTFAIECRKLKDENKSLKIRLHEKEGDISMQASRISQLSAQIGESEGKYLAADAKHTNLVNELFDHMGWFRRLLWDMKHENKN